MSATPALRRAPAGAPFSSPGLLLTFFSGVGLPVGPTGWREGGRPWYLSRWETRLVTSDRSPGLFLSRAFQCFGQSCGAEDFGAHGWIPACFPTKAAPEETTATLSVLALGRREDPRPTGPGNSNLWQPQPRLPASAPGTHVVLLVLEDGGIEGPLLPLLWGQGDLTAEPPGEKEPAGSLRAAVPTSPLGCPQTRGRRRTCWPPPGAAAGAPPSSCAAGAAESRLWLVGTPSHPLP